MPTACQPMLPSRSAPDHVLRGRPGVGTRLAELFPVFGLVHAQAGQIRRPADLPPGGTQGVGTPGVRVGLQDRAVAGVAQLDPDRILAFDRYRLPCRRACFATRPGSGTGSGCRGWSRTRTSLRCRSERWSAPRRRIRCGRLTRRAGAARRRQSRSSPERPGGPSNGVTGR